MHACCVSWSGTVVLTPQVCGSGLRVRRLYDRSDSSTLTVSKARLQIVRQPRTLHIRIFSYPGHFTVTTRYLVADQFYHPDSGESHVCLPLQCVDSETRMVRSIHQHVFSVVVSERCQQWNFTSIGRVISTIDNCTMCRVRQFCGSGPRI